MDQISISQDKVEKDLKALFSRMPTEMSTEVELPSRGKFYQDFKGVTVSPLLFEDEQRILLSKNKSINPINEILRKCIIGVNLNELLLIDKLFLLIKIKEISYGPEYKFEINCPKCNFRSEVGLDVSKHLPVNYAPDNLLDPQEIDLPMLKVKVKIRLPRVSDEQYIEDGEKAVKNLHRFVISIDGNDKPEFIAAALKKMHIRDLKKIHNAISRNDLGIDPRFIFKCSECEYESPMAMPFDANFFSVN